MLVLKQTYSIFASCLLAVGLAACSGGADMDSASADSGDNSGNARDGQTIVVFGASGSIGGLIVEEALARGHDVIGISRNPASLTVDHPAFTARGGDVTSVESFREVTQGADAVIISVQGTTGEGNLPENTVHALSAATAAEALAGMDSPYVLQIGGATTMFETPEELLANVPFPAPEGSEIRAMLLGHQVALFTYRDSDINWTVLTPPFAINGWTPNGIVDTNATGSFETSTEPFAPEAGEPRGIMVADLAAAAVQELEDRSYQRQRFYAAN